MTLPRITVITPSLNQAPYIERTLCSVLDQGYPNLEYIVIDGGSADETPAIIRQYEEDLAWWISGPDLGVAAALNKGLARATGDIVAFLPADDLYLPGALQAVAQAMSGAGASPWVAGHCVRIGPEDDMLGRLQAAAPPSLGAFLRHDAGLLPPSASFWARGLLEDCGGLDASMEYGYDYELSCKLLAGGIRPAVLDRALTARREHPGSRGAAQTLQQGMEYLQAARRYAQYLPLRQRYALWRNCDRRERIYALAQAELYGQVSRRYLWQRILRRPWWVADDNLRHALWHGLERATPPAALRQAA